jgi:hypothetical protein
MMLIYLGHKPDDSKGSATALAAACYIAQIPKHSVCFQAAHLAPRESPAQA